MNKIKKKKMLPYSAIDYAAYQTRSLMHATDNGGSSVGAAFTHSWLVPSTQDLCGTNFKPNHPQSQQILDPGHVEFFFKFYYLFLPIFVKF